MKTTLFAALSALALMSAAPAFATTYAPAETTNFWPTETVSQAWAHKAPDTQARIYLPFWPHQSVTGADNGLVAQGQGGSKL